MKHARLVFGLSPLRVSKTFNFFMLQWVYSKWGFLLKLDIDRIVHLLPEFAEAVHASGAPMTRVWGFVDGTVRSVARWATEGFRVDVPILLLLTNIDYTDIHVPYSYCKIVQIQLETCDKFEVNKCYL